MRRPRRPSDAPARRAPAALVSADPPPPVRVRRAEPADAGAILAYLARAGAESSNLTFGAEGPQIAEEEERAYIARLAATDNALFLVAERDGAVVGCLTFEGGARPRTRHAGEFGVSVARAEWGRGVGAALVEALLAWARDGGVIRKVNLRVRADNARAVALYERLGFAVEGRVTRDLLVDGAFLDCLHMGAAIDPPAGGPPAGPPDGPPDGPPGAV